jgi:hypothetical protein
MKKNENYWPKAKRLWPANEGEMKEMTFIISVIIEERRRRRNENNH